MRLSCDGWMDQDETRTKEELYKKLTFFIRSLSILALFRSSPTLTFSIAYSILALLNSTFFSSWIIFCRSSLVDVGFGARVMRSLLPLYVAFSRHTRWSALKYMNVKQNSQHLMLVSILLRLSAASSLVLTACIAFAFEDR
eukprot:scaffold13306_cov234-Alexandrium_tamarense.AAC.5